MEQSRLKSEPTTDEIRAGCISLFEEFYEWNTVEQLTGGDPLRIADAMKLTYNEAFTHLRYQHAKGEYQRKYHEIVSKTK